MKHIEKLTLEKIAEELNYSFSYIRQKHAAIVKTLKFLDKFIERKNFTNKMKSEIDYYKDEAQKADNYDI